ncbi:hypothetical protein PS2_132 [Serratia phage PS2]|uniref:Uncharacterized protein n=1 Tax=Serratia phage PS2 TaxID=1481112 RepID=A0A023W5N6_9CAUD|nr:hypothetical protein FF83_gp132 [Serratia phage PS2]AHY25378.1 hypothetical protein PS2_132 [Serratia phage PS2]
MKYEFERTNGIMYLNITAKKLIRVDLRRHNFEDSNAFYEHPRAMARALRPALAEFLKSTNGMVEYEDSDKAIILALAAKAVKITLDAHDYPSRSVETRGLKTAYEQFLTRVQSMLGVEAPEYGLNPIVEKFVDSEWSQCLSSYILIPYENTEEYHDVLNSLMAEGFHSYYGRSEYVIMIPGKNISSTPTRLGMKCTPRSDFAGTFGELQRVVEEVFVNEGWTFKRAFTTGYYKSLRDEVTLEVEMPDKFDGFGIQFERNGFFFDFILSSDSRINISPKEFFDMCSQYNKARVTRVRLQKYIDECRAEYDPTFVKGGSK